MKLTVVTDERGEIVGAMQGHVRQPEPSQPKGKAEEFRAGLVAGPGQTIQEIEVPEELGKIEDAEEFGRRLNRHMFGQARPDKGPRSA